MNKCLAIKMFPKLSMTNHLYRPTSRVRKITSNILNMWIFRKIIWCKHKSKTLRRKNWKEIVSCRAHIWSIWLSKSCSRPSWVAPRLITLIEMTLIRVESQWLMLSSEPSCKRHSKNWWRKPKTVMLTGMISIRAGSQWLKLSLKPNFNGHNKNC